MSTTLGELLEIIEAERILGSDDPTGFVPVDRLAINGALDRIMAAVEAAWPSDAQEVEPEPRVFRREPGRYCNASDPRAFTKACERAAVERAAARGSKPEGGAE